MGKRGQVTLFIISGLLILIAFSFYMYWTKNTEASVVKHDALDASPVKTYITSCIKLVADNGLFEKIGKQGGYIDAGSVKSEHVQGYRIPYHYFDSVSAVPSVKEVEGRLAGYIAEETKNCLDFSLFEQQGYRISAPQQPEISVSFNKEDTTVDVHYPLKISKGEAEIEVSEFNVVMPIRFKKVYDIGACFLEEIKSNAIDELNEFLAKKNCIQSYNSDEFITLQFVNNKYVLVYDYKTRYFSYEKTFKYQFAIEAS